MHCRLRARLLLLAQTLDIEFAIDVHPHKRPPKLLSARVSGLPGLSRILGLDPPSFVTGDLGSRARAGKHALIGIQ
jgi:hypothetical protein